MLSSSSSSQRARERVRLTDQKVKPIQEYDFGGWAREKYHWISLRACTYFRFKFVISIETHWDGAKGINPGIYIQTLVATFAVRDIYSICYAVLICPQVYEQRPNATAKNERCRPNHPLRFAFVVHCLLLRFVVLASWAYRGAVP